MTKKLFVFSTIATLFFAACTHKNTQRGPSSDNSLIGEGTQITVIDEDGGGVELANKTSQTQEHEFSCEIGEQICSMTFVTPAHTPSFILPTGYVAQFKRIERDVYSIQFPNRTAKFSCRLQHRFPHQPKAERVPVTIEMMNKCVYFKDLFKFSNPSPSTSDEVPESGVAI